MADTLKVTVDRQELQVNPGEQTEVVVTIQNDSVAVGVFSVEVEGLDPIWYNLSSTSVSLFPGDRATSTLVVNPPRISASHSGTYPFNVRVVSQKEDGEESSVSLSLDVTPFNSFLLDLSPQRLTGKRGTHTLSITNTGNSALAFSLEGRDPEELTRFTFDPESPTVEAGGLGTVTATVQGKRPLRGAPKSYQYSITASPPDGTAEPMSIPGFIEVPARIPAWVFRLVIVTIIVAVVTVTLLRLFVFKPEAPVDTFVVSPSQVSLIQGESTQIIAIARDEGGQELLGREVIWSSTDQSIALVLDNDGNVRGVSPGTAVLTANLVGEDSVEGQSTTVSVLPIAVSTDCIRYDPETLMFGVSAEGKLVLTDGSIELLTMGPNGDQRNAVRLATRHTARCFIGRSAAEQNGATSSIIEFWTGNSKIKVDEIDLVDCVPYSGEAVQIRAVEDGNWLVTDGGSLSVRMESQDDAQSARILISRNSQQCFINGPLNGGSTDTFLTQYWQ